MCDKLFFFINQFQRYKHVVLFGLEGFQGSFKKYVTRKMTFFVPSPPRSHLAFFSPTLLPIVSFTRKWQTMA